MWLGRLGGLAITTVALVGAYWSMRLAWSDWVYRDDTPQAIRRAIRLAPGNPDYYRELAALDAAGSVAALEEAARVDPLNSGIRIELGLAAESAHDFHKAEASLLDAVRLDKTFPPRWTLSEFYFRRRDTERFWPAVKAALATSYGDAAPLFHNCWTLSSDGREIMDRAIPDRLDILNQYLDYLIGAKLLADGAPIAGKLLARADQASTGALMRYCDRLLEAGRGPEALAVWNTVAERKLIPYAPLSPEFGRSLTNPAFGTPSIGVGFDWRIPPAAGIDVNRLPEPEGIDIGFSGKQAERCDILSQYVLLAPGREYVLSVRYRVVGIDTESGLTCRLLEGDNEADLLENSGRMPGGAAESVRSFRFTAPSRVSLARLVFGYRRAIGTTRIDGSVQLRGFALSFAPEDRR